MVFNVSTNLTFYFQIITKHITQYNHQKKPDNWWHQQLGHFQLSINKYNFNEIFFRQVDCQICWIHFLFPSNFGMLCIWNGPLIIVHFCASTKGPIVHFFGDGSLSTCQDINGGFAFSRCLNGTFPWRNCSVKTLVH